jgi:hypothetical protein
MFRRNRLHAPLEVARYIKLNYLRHSYSPPFSSCLVFFSFGAPRPWLMRIPTTPIRIDSGRNRTTVASSEGPCKQHRTSSTCHFSRRHDRRSRGGDDSLPFLPHFTADGIFDPPEILCRLEQDRFITASDPITAAYSRLAFAKVFPQQNAPFHSGIAGRLKLDRISPNQRTGGPARHDQSSKFPHRKRTYGSRLNTSIRRE